jgi:pantetheine-phosphate adenylyltransferase
MVQKTVLITGGIGSGKTTIARYINEYYGIPVFYSDIEAKKLYNDPQILAEISKLLGENIVSSDGSLDKKVLANIIFNDEEKKLKLESYIHPKVREYFKVWASQKLTPITIMESAVALKNGRDDFDYVVMIDAPRETCLARAMRRDDASKEKILARMQAQSFDRSLIDHTIWNEEGYFKSRKFKKEIDNLIKSIIPECFVDTEKKALFAGSFDPFTNGHFSILRKACGIFDQVYLCIANNADKKRKYPIEEMENAIKETIVTNNLTNCEVVVCDHLIADFCKELGVKYLIRGLRNTTDYLYEENISKINHEINPDLETVYLRGENDVISSSMIREFIKYGKPVEEYVPASIFKLIQQTN